MISCGARAHSVETKIFDLFGFDSSRLSKDGWYFMPYDEQLVFDHIKQAGKSLSEYTESTKSGSALFEGSSTGNKGIFVVRKVLESSARAFRICIIVATRHQVILCLRNAEKFQKIMEDLEKSCKRIMRRMGGIS